MTHPRTPAAARPHVLLLMSEGTFDLQFHAEQVDRLRDLAVVGEPLRLDDLDGPQARAQLAEADVIVTSWGAPPITPAHLAAAPRLRAILHAAGTVRGLVPDEAWARGIVVTSAADENARPVAEYTLAAIILAGKRAPFLAAEARTRRDGWSFADERGDLSNRGRTIGIVGWSRIGRRTVELLDVLETDARARRGPHDHRRRPGRHGRGAGRTCPSSCAAATSSACTPRPCRRPATSSAPTSWRSCPTARP